MCDVSRVEAFEAGDQRRLRMLESIREFAGSRLLEDVRGLPFARTSRRLPGSRIGAGEHGAEWDR